MLKIHTLTLGLYQTNTYIVYSEDAKTCCVIDPGYQAKTILSKVNELGLTVEAILLTHGHFDHVGAVKDIVAATNCQLWMSQSDYTMFKTRENDFLYPIHDCQFAPVDFCEEGEQIRASGLTLTVLETPGHTQGSVCYLCQDALFSGDTLFAGGIGRTDLPGGDTATIYRSLSRLAQLEGELAVYPGHGESTTLALEKKYNPYMR